MLFPRLLALDLREALDEARDALEALDARDALDVRDAADLTDSLSESGLAAAGLPPSSSDSILQKNLLRGKVSRQSLAPTSLPCSRA